MDSSNGSLHLFPLTQHITDPDYQGHGQKSQEPLSNTVFDTPSLEIAALRKINAEQAKHIQALEQQASFQQTKYQPLETSTLQSILTKQEVKILLEATLQTFMTELSKSHDLLKQLDIEIEKNQELTIEFLVNHLEKIVEQERRPNELSESWVWCSPQIDAIKPTLDEIHRLFHLGGGKQASMETLRKTIGIGLPIIDKKSTALSNAGTLLQWTGKGILFGYRHFWIITFLLGSLKHGVGGPIISILLSILARKIRGG